jgi:tRNA (guanine37-N1)-methyltransferase
MLGVRVRSGEAEALKKYLQKKAKLDGKHKVFSSNLFIYFPLCGEPDGELVKKLKEFGASVVDERFKLIQGRALRSSLAPEGASKGYDLYGSIAVIDAEPGAAKKMAKGLMRFNSNIRTVIRKGGAFSGKYRTRKFVYVAGKRNYITDGYKENGSVFRFDLRKVFFTPRLAFERKRINELVKDGENVVVMFAGIGPYAIEIAKSHRNTKVVAIELNRAACKYMRENIKLNKTDNVACEEGDVNRFVEKYRGFADRIIMPLPKDAPSFLPAAVGMSGGESTIHCYRFCQQDRIDETLAETKKFMEKMGAKVVGMTHRIVLPYSAKEVEIVIDIRTKIKKI